MKPMKIRNNKLNNSLVDINMIIETINFIKTNDSPHLISESDAIQFLSNKDSIEHMVKNCHRILNVDLNLKNSRIEFNYNKEKLNLLQILRSSHFKNEGSPKRKIMHKQQRSLWK